MNTLKLLVDPLLLFFNWVLSLTVCYVVENYVDHSTSFVTCYRLSVNVMRTLNKLPTQETSTICS